MPDITIHAGRVFLGHGACEAMWLIAYITATIHLVVIWIQASIRNG